MSRAEAKSVLEGCQKEGLFMVCFQGNRPNNFIIYYVLGQKMQQIPIQPLSEGKEFQVQVSVERQKTFKAFEDVLAFYSSVLREPFDSQILSER